jgi:hypothetical protein
MGGLEFMRSREWKWRAWKTIANTRHFPDDSCQEASSQQRPSTFHGCRNRPEGTGDIGRLFLFVVPPELLPTFQITVIGQSMIGTGIHLDVMMCPILEPVV